MHIIELNKLLNAHE